MKHFPVRFTIKDEIYQHKDFSRAKIRVLASLDSTKLDYTKPNIHREDKDFPVAWAKMYGKGRVFYSTFGHAAETWDDPQIQKMYFEATRWALRLTGDDVTPGNAGGNRQSSLIGADASTSARRVCRHFGCGTGRRGCEAQAREISPPLRCHRQRAQAAGPQKPWSTSRCPARSASRILRCPGSTGTPMNPGDSIAVF